MPLTKKISRSAKIGGGLVAAGLVVGTFLGKFLPGMGNGGALPMPGDPVQTQPQEKSEEPTESSPKIAVAKPGDVLTVKIEGRGYWVLYQSDGEEELRPANLDSLAKLALAAPGDGNGIRVRVTRDASARAKTEVDLKQKLLDVGLPPESIVGLENTAP